MVIKRRHIYLDPAKRVAAGATFLDEQEDGIGWAGKIDLDIFRIAESDRCVLGQLEGGYSYGMDRYDLTALDASTLGFDTFDRPDSYGILLSDSRRSVIGRVYRLQSGWTRRSGWGALQEAWHYEIATRQATLAERLRHGVAEQERQQARAACGGDSSARGV